MKPHFSQGTFRTNQDLAQRRRYQFRIRTFLIGVIILAVWLWAIRIDEDGVMLSLTSLVLVVLGMLGLSAAVFAVIAGLGYVGFGLLAMWDKLIQAIKPRSEDGGSER